MSESKSEWPFDVWLKTAVRGFGLSPSQFWQMSVRDWLALLSGNAEQSISRDEFGALMDTYPDKETK